MPGSPSGACRWYLTGGGGCQVWSSSLGSTWFKVIPVPGQRVVQHSPFSKRLCPDDSTVIKVSQHHLLLWGA